MRRSLGTLFLILLCGVAYLAFWPVSIEPTFWVPGPAPKLEGPYASNAVLHTCERMNAALGRGPEDVAIDAAGRIYAGFEDGRIMRFQHDGGMPELFANTGGRPLGLEFDSGGNLIVCDSYKGLLSVASNGVINVLSTEEGGRRFGFTDDLDIASDGTIYFTDASDKFGQKQYMEDLIEHQPNGRLLAYDPATKSTRLLMDKLYFANGVSVSPENDFVLVVETGAYRLLRYWLRGPKQGSAEPFIKDLPGFPDGVTTGEDGRFWVALAAPRDPLLDALAPHPWWRKVVMRLPSAVRPVAKRYSFALAVDANAQVVRNYQDPDAAYAPITNVREHDGYLYFGSIEENGIGRFKIPAN